MKKQLIFIGFLAALQVSCISDDQYTMDDFKNDISIVYQGNTVTVSGDPKGFVKANGAHVIVEGSNNLNATLNITLSGATTDGSLLVYNQRAYNIKLNGVSITNPVGPAINNQCGKSLYITSADGTTNTLTDSSIYASAPTNATGTEIDQKGTLFSEGQIYFRGNGTLTINGNAKNGIASDDYIIFEGGTINVNVSSTGSNGIKVNDGFTINGGTLNIDVKADGARGINSDATTNINGGTTTITTSGNCKIEETDGAKDTTSCAGIKSDSLLLVTGGTLNITSTGDGGKGINCSMEYQQTGGILIITTTGTKSLSNPQGLKADGNITISGGEAYVATTRKAFTTDASFFINGGTVMGIGKKASSDNQGSQKSYTEEDEDVDKGATVISNGVTYTVPSFYSCKEAYILTSKKE